MNHKEIFGCAAFGLTDQVFQVEGEPNGSSFCLAEAVLPALPSGTIRTGTNAKEQRIHTGLSWPPEARVSRKAPLRRAPIACVWRGLVEAGDRLARWQVGRGVSFTLNRILSEHLVNLLKKAGCRPQDEVVLAIPDALDEFGQETLLRDLKNMGFENIQLLWRPVAAALSWVSELDQKNAFGKNTDTKEHIMVVYLGPDGVEMTTFRLKREKHENTEYVIPVRERPRQISSVTGFDWVANALEAAFPDMDDGAFWQAFTKFPHMWEAVSGRPFSSNRVEWSFNNYWTFWNPDETLREFLQRASSAPNLRLRTLLANSCRLFTTVSGSEEVPTGEGLAKLFTSVLNSRPQSRLRGVIVAGALCPPELPQWIRSNANELQARGIKEVPSNSPRLDAIWLAHGENALVDGCAEYGRRLDMNLPTYRDTLPQLSMLVEQHGDHKWVNLLNAETCKGGKPHKPDPIQGKFAIQAGTQHLQVYLKRKSMQGRGSLDLPETPDEYESSLPANRQSEIKTKVQKAGSYEDVLKIFVGGKDDAYRFARRVARELFGNPFRRAEFVFPSVPEENMPVDVAVEIRPASGLAQITLVPSNPADAAFMRGRQIFLDYSTMEEADPPPQPTRGWPDVVQLEIDPTASFLRNFNWEISRYLKDEPCSSTFIKNVEGIKRSISQLTNTFTGDGYENLRPIDQNGMAGTQEGSMVVDLIASKAARDFPHIQQAYKKKFVTRMSRLFAKTPENVREEIRKYISQNQYNDQWRRGVEAAGMVFIANDDFQLLYANVFRRIKSAHRTSFPLQSYKALWRLLSLRENSPMAMTRSQAKTFTKEAVKMMEGEAGEGRYMLKFFQAARVFLFLLRFRIVDKDFLDPDNPVDSDLFNQTLRCLRKAQKHFSRSHSNAGNRARELVIGIEKFMRYEGSNDILKLLDELAGEN